MACRIMGGVINDSIKSLPECFINMVFPITKNCLLYSNYLEHDFSYLSRMRVCCCCLPIRSNQNRPLDSEKKQQLTNKKHTLTVLVLLWVLWQALNVVYWLFYNILFYEKETQFIFPGMYMYRMSWHFS